MYDNEKNDFIEEFSGIEYDIKAWSNTPQAGFVGAYLVREVALPRIQKISDRGLVTIKLGLNVKYEMGS